MKRLFIKLMVALLILLIVLLCYLTINKKVKRIMYFAIYPYSTTEHTHVFEIFSDNRIEYYYGVREAEIIDEIKLKEIEKRKTIRISKEQLKQIKNYVKKFEVLGDLSLEGPGWDSLEILLITERNRINILYPPLKERHKIIEEFLEFIKKTTNLDILDK